MSIADDRSELGFNKASAALVTRNVAPAFGLAVEGARRAQLSVDHDATELLRPRFDEGSTPATRAEQRAWWRGLSFPAKTAAVEADHALAAAVIEGGPAMSALPSDVFDRLRRSMAVRQLAMRIANDANLRTAPSADDPVGGKPDLATARANAADKLNRLDDEVELIGRIPAMLANVVTATALLTGETRADAFARLSA
ncbi:MAG: hypothetical protein WA954_02505 [Parerythrobacter sp.]